MSVKDGSEEVWTHEDFTHEEKANSIFVKFKIWTLKVYRNLRYYLFDIPYTYTIDLFKAYANFSSLRPEETEAESKRADKRLKQLRIGVILILVLMLILAIKAGKNLLMLIPALIVVVYAYFFQRRMKA